MAGATGGALGADSEGDVERFAHESRIACVAPLGVGRFIDFTFRHFYPAVFAAHSYLEAAPQSGWGERTLSRDEERRAHISWGV